jgi:hypothetical protein
MIRSIFQVWWRRLWINLHVIILGETGTMNRSLRGWCLRSWPLFLPVFIEVIYIVIVLLGLRSLGWRYFLWFSFQEFFLLRPIVSISVLPRFIVSLVLDSWIFSHLSEVLFKKLLKRLGSPPAYRDVVDVDSYVTLILLVWYDEAPLGFTEVQGRVTRVSLILIIAIGWTLRGILVEVSLLGSPVRLVNLSIHMMLLQDLARVLTCCIVAETWGCLIHKVTSSCITVEWVIQEVGLRWSTWVSIEIIHVDSICTLTKRRIMVLT